MPSATITLSQPIVGHNGPIGQLTLREPKFREIMRFGEPFSRGYAADGSVIYSAENTDAIRGYLETLIQEPANAILIEQLNVVDTLRLKDALIDFFTTARSRLSAEATKDPSKLSGGTSTS